MDKNEIKERFKNLTVWKRGGERSPHKALLSLYAIGKLIQKKERLIPYQEIDEYLTKLLVDFGPNRKAYHPEYPFWRLQKDHIWEVNNGGQLKETSSGDVKKKDLIFYQVNGGFSEDVFNQLCNDKQLVIDVVQELLNDNFPSTIHEDILQSIGIDIFSVKRKRDPEFRERILRAYEYKCAICGFNVRINHIPIALEAAHIQWFQAGGPDIETNGLALCALHHKLFDRGALTISENLEIMVSDRANGTQGFNEWLMKFHGNKLKLPQRQEYLPDNNFRDWHIREVFQGSYREIK
ncbi:MAG: HNH endonuclease [Desulfamplus sp.]|nr:HNH endonuclease [Desulfamplus sp.]